MVFKPMNWQPLEMISDVKMKTLIDNMEYLYNYTPRGLYTVAGLNRDIGSRICSGRALIKVANDSDQTAQVQFGNFFSSGCEPAVSTGIITTGAVETFCTISGIGQLLPNASGFNINVKLASNDSSKNKITSVFYVTWHAMGY